MNQCELLSPAGSLDSAYAALHYGADAIYLGLKKFSARAEAENFTLQQVDSITAFAHSPGKRRKIFVTINTLLQNSEIPELIDSLAALSDIGVDAIIVQDLGVLHIARKCFPELALHASTQMAVHNAAGAHTARALGFRRVTLARELTLDEIRRIAAESGLETEVFLHGALCYSYSGLCLYSALNRGGSGNRGRCNYPCRDSFRTESGEKCHPFSMKDIALPDELPALRKAGVISFKIEGRKKSPLYVAATTAFYRKLIDGQLGPDERKQYEDDIKTIFSRPWTNLYVRSANNRNAADSETVGHRGAPIGKVHAVVNPGSKTPALMFRTERAIERHDGLQIDLPGKPFGFPVDTILLVPVDGRGKCKSVFEAPAGSMVQVILPPGHPTIEKGATIYCSSSQSVKQQYDLTLPKSEKLRVRKEISVEITVSTSKVQATVSCGPITAEASVAGSFEKGKDSAAMETAARGAFEKLGDTAFQPGSFSFHNPDGLFVPVSMLNRLRREVTAGLGSKLEAEKTRLACDCKNKFEPACRKQPERKITWSIKTDCLANLSGFTSADWNDVSEVVVDISTAPLELLVKELAKTADAAGREKLRLALPMITRAREEKALVEKINRLCAEGWTRWEAANISAWSFLPDTSSITSDWSVYVMNRAAARQVLEMGAGGFVLSPEDSLENTCSILGEFGEKATVIVYQDTPLFLSATCGLANIDGHCPGHKHCADKEMPLVSGKKEQVLLITRDCTTIVINRHPYSAADNVEKLISAGASRFRAGFMYRRYTPAKVLETWHRIHEQGQ